VQHVKSQVGIVNSQVGIVNWTQKLVNELIAEQLTLILRHWLFNPNPGGYKKERSRAAQGHIW